MAFNCTKKSHRATSGLLWRGEAWWWPVGGGGVVRPAWIPSGSRWRGLRPLGARLRPVWCCPDTLLEPDSLWQQSSKFPEKQGGWASIQIVGVTMSYLQLYINKVSLSNVRIWFDQIQLEEVVELGDVDQTLRRTASWKLALLDSLWMRVFFLTLQLISSLGKSYQLNLWAFEVSPMDHLHFLDCEFSILKDHCY